MDAYATVNQVSVSPLRRTAHWLVYARRHPLVTDMLITLPFETYHVLFPSLFRMKVTESKLVSVDKSVFCRQVERFGEITTIHTPGDTLFTHFRALRHTERVADISGYLGEVTEWVRSIHQSGGRVAVKAHPRESNRHLLRGLRASGATELPHELPAEILTALMESDCLLTSGLSTFVLTSRLMLPERKVSLEGAVDPALASRLARWDPTVRVN
jgi:hypothetical protein